MTARNVNPACHRLLPAACLALAALSTGTAQAQLHAAIEHEDEPRVDASEQVPPERPTDGRDGQAMNHAGVHDPAAAAAQRSSPSAAPDHVAPAPPAHAMSDMPDAQMIDVMGMNDDATFGLFLLDRFERVKSDAGDATSWNAEGWLGRDFDKFWFKTEGETADGAVEQADAQLLWSHAVAPFWDSQLGVRHDFGRGPDRSWSAFGVQGLAPYWFEVAVTAYVGEQGRTALRLESEYELLLTQRLVLQPRFELNAYGKTDPAAGIGSGLSDAEFGLRLRYEIRREIAPYIGVEWRRAFGDTAAFARLDGERAFDRQWVVGVRLWF